MGRIVLVIIAVLASIILDASAKKRKEKKNAAREKADSLICNKCSVGLVGFCLNSAEETCSTNTSLCFTARASFPAITDFVGFNTQGCREGDGCVSSSNGTLLGALYEVTSQCCDSDKCNPLQLSGAPSSARLSFTTVLGAAAVASVWSLVWM